jgi:predicted N-acetyltransferase YhbS
VIEITFLADNLEAIPTLSQWFRAQWPGYFAERTLADIAQDFVAEANRSSIPVRLVAFADGELAGTITLREEATWTLPEYQPGLGGLFVPEQHRGQGIGTELVKAGMNVAQEQGYESVYATTVAARGILARLGWKPVQVALPSDNHGLLYQYEF